MPVKEIEELKDRFVEQFMPVSVYLFGSYASGDFNEESGLDFYIVLKDGATNLAELTAKAYRAIRQIKRRPVDIVMGTQSRFEERKIFPSIENEVFEKGVLLYEA